MARCDVCFRHCELKDGQLGFCQARACRDGKVIPANYGWNTAIHIDPIEKKPLSGFYPGSLIYSVGSYGCNLRCPFCQNHEISWGEEALECAEAASERMLRKEPVGAGEELPDKDLYPYIPPEELAADAARYRRQGVIGIAFTYNEPLIGYEYVLDTAKIVHSMGMKNVLVTNGTAEVAVLEKLLPYIDAMNVDLKGFTDRYYKVVLGGDRKMVMDFIARAVKDAHVELTTLIIPGENDSEEEMLELASWVSQLKDGQGAVIGGRSLCTSAGSFPVFI